MPKKTASEIGYGSFDKPNMQLLNNYIIFLFLFATRSFRHSTACNILLVRYFQDLSNGILHVPKLLKCQSLNQKNFFLQSFNDQAGQKNRSQFWVWVFLTKFFTSDSK